MSSENLFCKIIQNQFNSTIDRIDSIIQLPLKGIRDVKSNIQRVENLVYSITKNEVTRIENLVIEILFLNQINQLQQVDNFCRVAFSCQILMETLINNSEIYLSFLDSTTISQLSADYGLFEKYVCILGLRNIINNFTDNILEQFKNRLIELLSSMEDALRLDELRYWYNNALINSGIFNYLNELQKFANCSWEVCDWANTSVNKISDYTDKLAISLNNVSATGWGENIDSLLENYYDLDGELETKINDLIYLIDNRNPERGIPRDKLMIS
jgi:hypothetical protein